jgi:hypothetical protein
VPFRFLLAIGLAIGLPALLQAQINNNRQTLQRQQQQAAMQQPAEIRGRIQNAGKGVLVVFTNNNQAWKAAILPVTRVHVTGTMSAKYLHSGLIVDFVAEIDDHGVILGKVDALTVTSLTRDKQLGLFPSGEGKDDGVVDGFGPAADKDKKDSGDAGSKHGKRTGKASSHSQAGKYRIIGQLVVGRGGVLSVQTRRGAPQLQLELADQAKIGVDMSDFSLVSRGNEVSVKGYVTPGRAGIIQAAEVQIKLPEPQVDEQQAPAETKKPPKRTKKAKDKDESESGSGGDPAAAQPPKKAKGVKGKDKPEPEAGGDPF